MDTLKDRRVVVTAFLAGAGAAMLAQKLLAKKKYVPDKVWKCPEGEEAKLFGSNKPTAGAQSQKELPRGEHALQLYSMGTPNGVKVTILLEELIEAMGASAPEYDAWLVRISANCKLQIALTD